MRTLLAERYMMKDVAAGTSSIMTRARLSVVCPVHDLTGWLEGDDQMVTIREGVIRIQI